MNDVEVSNKTLTLRLSVRNDTIFWFLWQASALKDYMQPISEEKEPFEQSSLSRATIDFLTDQQLFLATISRDNHIPGTALIEAREISYNLIRLLGEYLYTTLFKGQIHARLTAMLKDQELNLLRIELEFEDERLASWPWEYLYRPWDKTHGSGLFLAEITSLVLNRKFPFVTVPQKLATPKPVRVLVIVSSPKNLARVAYDKVINTITELQAKGVVKLHTLIEEFEFSATYQSIVTRKNVRNTIQEFRPHFIHFIGHSRRTDRGGQVAFVKEDGEADWVSEAGFASIVDSYKDLKLVFLQACESNPENTLLGPYNVLGMARELAQSAIPAVVAMQYNVESEIANVFASDFYKALADGRPVDLAVKAGRNAIKYELPGEWGERHAFVLPVLYLSGYESIFAPEELLQKASTTRPISSSTVLSSFSAGDAKCPKCHAAAPLGKKFCGKCGLRFVCQHCNTRLTNPLGKFCNECGRPINAQ